MKTVALAVHPTRKQAQDAAIEFRKVAVSVGLDIVDWEHDFEAIIALGGDGTILRAAARAITRNVPLMGVNLGRLGYLSTVDSDMLDEAIRKLASDDFTIEDRMMLAGEFLGAGAVDAVTEQRKMVALNEIVAEKATPSRVIDIDVSVDGNLVATYTADGFIVATPTGSTAYSLSAGGPIIEPGHDSILLTPVSAHSPLWRSIVVKPERSVELRASRGPAALSFDGQIAGEISEGQSVRISKHDRPLQLIRLNGYEFFARVRHRFRIEASRDLLES